MHGQRLSGPPLPDPVAVVRWLGAVQAQEYAVAKWSLGQRTVGFDDAAVQRALDEGAMVRTHALRPTWHFIAAEDLTWIQALTGPRVHVFNGHYYRRHGLDDEVAAKTNAVITRVLRGGNHLTRPELAAALAKDGIEASGNKLAYVVLRAELDGVIVNGPRRGKQHTYALVRERLGEGTPLFGDEALAELTRRYFASHGPATIKDFAWWSSLTVAQIKRGLRLVGSAITAAEIDGRTFYFAPSDPPPVEPSPTVHLLQTYDEYVVAYAESRSVLNLAGRTLSGLNDNALVHPIVVDTQFAGYWRRVPGRASIVVTPILLVRATKTLRRAIEAEFGRYAAFAGQPVEVTWPASSDR
jgi:hypothetical protein